MSNQFITIHFRTVRVRPGIKELRGIQMVRYECKIVPGDTNSPPRNAVSGIPGSTNGKFWKPGETKPLIDPYRVDKVVLNAV